MTQAKKATRTVARQMEDLPVGAEDVEAAREGIAEPAEDNDQRSEKGDER